ncbi:MAG: hypothetical protein AB2826_26725 [Candidatus Thiodiazotropha sp.]
MKIDIHTHTKKTKQGDAATREIDAKTFHEIVSSTEVKILAITNHNVFDLGQFDEFVATVGSDFQIWPGVELDILEEDRRGHLIVIVAPGHAKSFSEKVKSASEGMTPDNFSISIDDVISNFDSFNPLYIAHYKQKKPDLTDKDIEKIISHTAFKNRVLKEATNAISAGIFLSHGHSSIYGSDVANWKKYQAYSEGLPDLRLPVESFEQFCLLLNKDSSAINTLLDKKQPEKIKIKPFKDDPAFSLTVYDDINVFFGAKGTGKSDILEAIAKYYAKKGISASRYESGSGLSKLNDIFDLNGKKLKIDLKDYEIAYCNKEIDFARKSHEVNITSLSKYRQFFSESLTNKKANKIKIKDFKKDNLQALERALNEVEGVYKNFMAFLNYIATEDPVKKLVDSKKLESLIDNIQEIIEDLNLDRSGKFNSYRTSYLFNNLIDKIKKEISRKTGTPEKPSDTGFKSYALNRIELEKSVNTIIENTNKKIEIDDLYVGNLDEKGDLYCKTEIIFQNGSISDGNFSPLSNVNKTPQKEFSKKLKEIQSSVYSSMLFERITELNAIEGIETIPSILELLIFKKYFSINDKKYAPSTGESSMIMLHKELTEEKDVYILDEPEKSLGNEYINNVILPLIKEKAKAKKKVFIATHDANIAVRTLPYNSIYRYHGKDGYLTFIGNPFTNNLVNLVDDGHQIDWKEISMRTLEGGIEAFGERGLIYGYV